MSTNEAMIWLLAQTIVTLAILTIGTLAAAELLGREKRVTRPVPGPARRRTASPTRRGREAAGRDIVDVWSRDSFPASDPPANW